MIVRAERDACGSARDGPKRRGIASRLASAGDGPVPLAPSVSGPLALRSVHAKHSFAGVLQAIAQFFEGLGFDLADSFPGQS